MTATEVASDPVGPTGGRPAIRRPGRAALVVVAAILVLGGILVVTGGFDRVFGSAADRATRSALPGRRFVVRTITEDGRPKALVGPALDGEPAIAHLTFEHEWLHANGGCNTTSGSYEVVDGRLIPDAERSTTAAACAPEVMAQDAWLGSFLLAGPTITLDGERLILTSGSTTIELLERPPPPDSPAPTALPLATDVDLAGRTFVATAALVDGVERRIVGPEEVPHLALRFDDGAATVSAGCGRGSAPYRLDRGRIEGLALATTADVPCSPAELDQNEWLNGFFATPPSLTLDGDYLTLGDQTRTLLVFVDEAAATPAVEPPGLQGNRWSLDVARSVPGYPSSSAARFESYLVLSADEPPTLYLRDGCNVITGAVRIEPASPSTGSLAVGEVSRTDAPCPSPVDQVADAVGAVLDGTWSYEIDGQQLELTDGLRTLTFTTP